MQDQMCLPCCQGTVKGHKSQIISVVKKVIFYRLNTTPLPLLIHNKSAQSLSQLHDPSTYFSKTLLLYKAILHFSRSTHQSLQ